MRRGGRAPRWVGSAERELGGSHTIHRGTSCRCRGSNRIGGGTREVVCGRGHGCQADDSEANHPRGQNLSGRRNVIPRIVTHCRLTFVKHGGRVGATARASGVAGGAYSSAADAMYRGLNKELARAWSEFFSISAAVLRDCQIPLPHGRRAGPVLGEICRGGACLKRPRFAP